MKKLIGGILASVMLFTAGAMVGCDSSESSHEHAYVEKTISATCTQEGYNQFVCECGDSYKGETVLPKTAHTGMGSCFTCGLDYYEELTNLIKTNSTTYSNSVYYVAGSRTEDGIQRNTYIAFDEKNFVITVGMGMEFLEGTGLDGCTEEFRFMIEHPSESTAIQTGKYTWFFATSYSNMKLHASGVLNGETFSKKTVELKVSSGDNGLGGFACDDAQYLMENAFIPLLKLGKNGVTPANLGFTNFSL